MAGGKHRSASRANRLSNTLCCYHAGGGVIHDHRANNHKHLRIYARMKPFAYISLGRSSFQIAASAPHAL